MSTTEFFEKRQCPRCTFADSLQQVGDAHYIVTPLVYELDQSVIRAPDLTCYVKACANCGYVEFFSKQLVDKFVRDAEEVKRFGEITQMPDGQYLLSIFREYDYRGTRARDFTVPLSAEQMFQLSTLIDQLADQQIVEIALHEPYKRAWTERIGAIPGDLGSKLRTLLQEYLRHR